jgi:hypothetical protein
MNRKFPAARPLFYASIAFFAPFVFAVVLLLSGCELYGKVGGDGPNIPGSLPFPLRGTWVYIQSGNDVPAEQYIIADTDTVDGPSIEYGYGGGSSPYDYAGTIAFVSNYSSDSGVIIVKYDPAKKPEYSLYNGGDYGAVYYRNLRAGSVQLANAIKLSDMSAPDTATLDEAVEKFTRMMMGTYVDWGAVQPQQRAGE